jgi:hypothetical protein
MHCKNRVGAAPTEWQPVFTPIAGWCGERTIAAVSNAGRFAGHENN